MYCLVQTSDGSLTRSPVDRVLSARRQQQRPPLFERSPGRRHKQRLDRHLAFRAHGPLERAVSAELSPALREPPRSARVPCSVPLIGGVGTQVEASSPTGVYYNLAGGSSCRTMDLRLTDWLGRPVNLRGRPLALLLIFD